MWKTCWLNSIGSIAATGGTGAVPSESGNPLKQTDPRGSPLRDVPIDEKRESDMLLHQSWRHPTRTLLPLEGEIDLHVSPQIGASLGGMVAKKPAQLVVDLSKVSYIDSSGLAVLIEAMQDVNAYGGKFALSGLQESVRPIFEIARLDQVFRIFPDTASALGK